ncbi:MAG: tRNA lysidine(34) synthetase TilS [Mycoplasma sp.]
MYIFAVSGGPDSMAMLSMYKRKAKAVCVVNYKKRTDSDYDVQCVIKFCKLHNIKYYVLEVTEKIYDIYSSEKNFQTKARKIRYNFFKEVCLKEKTNKIMVAHNLNDHLETAYMQKQRKSRTLFLGIQKKSEYEGMKVYRPLLNLQKKTLERYCKQKDIDYAIDSSNQEDIYERNKVRKIINTWDYEKMHAFINEIRKFNKKNKRKHKTKNKIFCKWQKQNFNINFFNLQNEEFYYYLIYDFLKFHEEKNNSKNKIESIIEFIKSNKHTNGFRLENNKKLALVNQSLEIIDNAL